MIDYCHRLTLSDPNHPVLPSGGLGELSRLAITVQYMRDALVDFMSLYRRFFEAAPDMLLTLSPAGGRILNANQAFSRALGLLNSEVMGKRVDEFVELEAGWDAVLQGLEGLHKGQMRTYGGYHKDRGQRLDGIRPKGPAMGPGRHAARRDPPRGSPPPDTGQIHRPGKRLEGDKKRGRLERSVFDDVES